MTWHLVAGDARTCLGELPPKSVQCVVTSPPYWGLRDYGVAGQLGLESTPGAYVAALVAVFAEVWRVLRDDGTCWVNLGDTYSGPAGSQDGVSRTSTLNGINGVSGVYRARLEKSLRAKPNTLGDLKVKNLIGIPWRVAFALQAEGWYLRSDIIWSKPNPMPESVTDRPTKAHEYLFLLSKQERYYYDAAAIAEPSIDRESLLGRRSRNADRFTQSDSNGKARTRVGFAEIPPGTLYETRNARSVWTIPPEPYPDAHFATFPTALVEPCVLAGTKAGDTVLDPFCGSGTVGAVAIGFGRAFVGIELNPAYVELARTRISAVAPLFALETHTTSRGESRNEDRQAKLFDFSNERVGVG